MSRRRFAASGTAGGVVLLVTYVIFGPVAYVAGGGFLTIAGAFGSAVGGIVAGFLYLGGVSFVPTEETRATVDGVGLWEILNPLLRLRLGVDLWTQEGTLSAAKDGGIVGAAAGLFGVVPAAIVA